MYGWIQYQVFATSDNSKYIARHPGTKCFGAHYNSLSTIVYYSIMYATTEFTENLHMKLLPL